MRRTHLKPGTVLRGGGLDGCLRLERIPRPSAARSGFLCARPREAARRDPGAAAGDARLVNSTHGFARRSRLDRGGARRFPAQGAATPQPFDATTDCSMARSRHVTEPGRSQASRMCSTSSAGMSRGSLASRHGGAVGAAAIRSVAQRSCMTSQRRKQRTIVVTQPADAGACRRMYSSTNLRTHAASSCAGSSLTVLSSAWATGNECPIVAAARPRLQPRHRP